MSDFWRFLLDERILQAWRTDSPARTLVRLAYKSYQMGLPFSMSDLSLCDGKLFSSHMKKVEEMKNDWGLYPFSDYKLKVVSKKTSIFGRARADCSCGLKANLRCISNKCSKCCRSALQNCKVHIRSE